MTRTTDVRYHRRRKPSGGTGPVKRHKRRVKGWESPAAPRIQPRGLENDAPYYDTPRWGGDVISVYTRDQAIDDGFQRDVSKESREVGIMAPTTITVGVMEEIEVPEGLEGQQDERGRLHDVLWMASLKARTRMAHLKSRGMSSEEIEHDMRILPFEVQFADSPKTSHTTKFWMVFSEYEGFTIMTPSEY